MKGFIEFIFWVFVVCLILAYCARQDKNETFVETSFKFVKVHVNELDSIWNNCDK